MKTVAVIGAGVSGLTAIKSCLEDGLEPTCFEQTAYLGGLWYYTDEVRTGQGCTAKTTVTNVSKEMGSFSDYPMPEEFPNYLHHTKVLEYLRMYSAHFKLEERIRFQVEVVSVKAAPDFDSTGQWIVATRYLATGEQTRTTFDAVLVCNGHYSEPYKPELEGQDTFRGQLVHTNEYRDHCGYEDTRVLVVGMGNTAGDVAVDLSRVAKQVYLSTRHGAWVIDRLANHGFPIDLCGLRRVVFFIRRIIPTRLFRWLLESELNAKFDHASYCLRPMHPASVEVPIVNDELPNRVICGSVIIKPGVTRLTTCGVEFADGTSISDIEIVLLATGYVARQKFFKESRLRHSVEDLYRHVFPPDLKHPTLALIGAVRQIGPLFSLVEMQCRWANRVFKGQCSLPSEQAMLTEIEDSKRAVQARRPDTRLYSKEVEWLPYTDLLAADVGCKPNIGTMWLRDPSLAWRCFFGPCTPYQFRLRGPGQWPGARQAIVTSWQRVLYPLQTRPCPPPKTSIVAWTLIILVGSIAVTFISMWLEI